MSIVDLTSRATSQIELRKKINEQLFKLVNETSNFCYQCARCTSGCEAHKLLELEPHKITALLIRGLIDEMINSEVIWTCMSCYKCLERCPQRVAPVEILNILKNMAIAQGKQVPGDYTNMLQNIMSTGLIQTPKDIAILNRTVSRDSLGLPAISTPKNIQKFTQFMMAAAAKAP
jgi:heterodisulfide reductase subunit C